jgi:hypothetical protein
MPADVSFNPPPLPTLAKRYLKTASTSQAAAHQPESFLWRLASAAPGKILEAVDTITRWTTSDENYFMLDTRENCVDRFEASGVFTENEIAHLRNHEALLNFDSVAVKKLSQPKIFSLNLEQSLRAEENVRSAEENLTEGYIGPGDPWRMTTRALFDHHLRPLGNHITKLTELEAMDQSVRDKCREAITEATPELASEHPSHQAMMVAFAEKMHVHEPEPDRVDHYRTAIQIIQDSPKPLKNKVSPEEYRDLQGAYHSYAIVARSFLSKYSPEMRFSYGPSFESRIREESVTLQESAPFEACITIARDGHDLRQLRAAEHLLKIANRVETPAIKEHQLREAYAHLVVIPGPHQATAAEELLKLTQPNNITEKYDPGATKHWAYEGPSRASLTASWSTRKRLAYAQQAAENAANAWQENDIAPRLTELERELSRELSMQLTPGGSPQYPVG